MSVEKITAEAREEFGKGAARRIRREAKIPAVVYEHGDTPMHVSLPGHDTMMALKRGGANALLDLVIDGKSQLALTKHVQIDPIRRVIEHIDFIAVKRGEKVLVDIPVIHIGEAGPDTLVINEADTIQVEAEATHIPEHFEVDIAGAPVGTMIHAADIKLPSGVTLVSDPEALIINISQQVSAEQLEAQLEAAEAAAGIEHDASDVEIADAKGAAAESAE